MRREVYGAVVVGLAGFLFGRGGIPLPVAASSPHEHPAATFARFTGAWFTHGGQLHIAQDGSGWYALRAYVNCSQTRQTNCDKVIGNAIYSGIFAVFRLNKTVGATASGTITNTSQSWQFQEPITLKIGSNGVLSETSAGQLGPAFCNAHSRPLACGA